MISTSSAFNFLVNKYIKEENAKPLLLEMNRFELEINKNKIKLSTINAANYNMNLEAALTHIDFADKILAWCTQLRIRIKLQKHLVEKKLDRETIIINKEIEESQEIALMTSKTEKVAAKNKLLKEKLIDRQQEYEDVKLDYETIEAFVNEAINFRDSRYAYYQAVKNIKID